MYPFLLEILAVRASQLQFLHSFLPASTPSAWSRAQDAPPFSFFCKCKAFADGAVVKHTLIDTGATFSMVPISTLAFLRSSARAENFEAAPPNIIGVGCSCALVRGFVDVPFDILDVEFHHPIIIVEELALPLLIGTDVLRIYPAVIDMGVYSVRLTVRQCDVCVEPRFGTTSHYRSTPPVACVASSTTLDPITVDIINMKLSPCLLSVELFALDTLLRRRLTALRFLLCAPLLTLLRTLHLSKLLETQYFCREHYQSPHFARSARNLLLPQRILLQLSTSHMTRSWQRCFVSSTSKRFNCLRSRRLPNVRLLLNLSTPSTRVTTTIARRVLYFTRSTLRMFARFLRPLAGSPT